MSKGILVVALVLVIFAALAAWFVGKSLEGDGHAISTPAFMSQDTAATLRGIERRLEAIEGRLTAIAENHASKVAPTPARSSDTSEREALLQAIRALRPAQVGGGEPSPWPVLLAREFQQPPRWDELQRFYEDFQRDRAEAVRSVLFQPASKIWERFGTPNQIPALEGTVTSGVKSVGYSRESDSGVQDVEFFFECGFVVGAYPSGN